MSIFFAGRTTHIGAAASHGTGPGSFSHPTSSGAQHASAPTGAQAPSAPGLAEWLHSDAAKALGGRWVLLSDSFEVIDSAQSPGELLDGHPDESSPLIVFVQPQGIELAV